MKEQKKQTVLKDGTINFLSTEDLTEPGGMEGISAWVKEKKKILDNPEKAELYGEVFPKGILITGLPGSGKSMTAKYIAHAFGDIPLIQFSLSKVLTGIVGGTEEKLDRALKLIEASSPCVVWIDEIEKELSGTVNSGNSDSGVASRCLARLLNWMQENPRQCFICATANSIQSLPSEFLRRGRFDRKYYTFLPMQEQCEDIMVNLLQKVDRKTPALLSADLKSRFKDLAASVLDYAAGFKGKYYTGADLEGLIEDARSELFRKDTSLPYSYDVFQQAMFQAVRKSKPYGETNFYDVINYWLALRGHPFLNAAVPEGKLGDVDEDIYRKFILFDFSDFEYRESKWKWKPQLKCSSERLYDKNMFSALKQGIEQEANRKAIPKNTTTQ